MGGLALCLPKTSTGKGPHSVKINPIQILRYSVVVIIVCVLVLLFINPSVSLTGPILMALIGLIALGAAARRKKSDDLKGGPKH